jgi:hypothetical protein
MVAFASGQSTHVGDADGVEHAGPCIPQERLPTWTLEVRSGLALVAVLLRNDAAA